jgi:hypothetical protein
MKRVVLLVLALGLLVAGALSAQTTTASDEGSDVLRFDTMTGVVAPFTGAANPIRGVPGGGLPWELDRASGRLRADGRLDIKVRGLVLARRAPVPPALQGTNPVPQFRAIVSCLTPSADGTTVETVNRTTDAVPATMPGGDARIRAMVDLPEPCIAPIVFVTSPTGAWFAATGI